ncbi:MCE family protein [Nocardia terpenica]|uniref:Mammalian cell entry protein n=1 Tax=Nocardia terpenica TaxID=455432 RepID=A0A164GXU6_9NOCA|nr:MCE family protein [Nocardia terpenica]KZM68042.1 mammalian cell entry protein [Nocardia terpenica]MBF6063083.1 MCE family protein [Nocardia terpenica]MBF6104782.1 MCE family protein [Nocardia terpenica]MBF6112782.1 MCE family protein [Nocardia terpenica]MBF6118510.1 MCE family protein [Nocardia terpenica]
MNWLTRHKMLLANLGLVLALVIGASYLAVSVMRVNPLRRTYTVTVDLDRSGGLQPGNDVTLRGYRIGKVNSIVLADHGASIAAEVQIDNRYRIPSDARVAVQALSGAGEQYIDFRPETDRGPFLGNGSVVRFDPQRVSTPTPIVSVLENSSAFISQIDPNRFSSILNDLDTALSGGPDQLRNMIDALSEVTAGLDNLLPQTTNLLTNLRTIASTTSDAQPDLGTLTRNSGALLSQFNNADDELRRVLDKAPGQLQQLGAVLDKTADPITNLATNFAAITKAAQLRVPALRALFPSLVVGSSAMGVPAHDGEFYTITDIWPRPFCQYSTKPTAPYVALDGTLPKWNYCSNPPPDQQIRGSANAPRPDVPNNGAQMPAGVDPNERTLPPVR